LTEEDKKAQYQSKLYEVNKSKMSKTSANPNASPTSPAKRKSPEELIKQTKNIQNV
jgi:hypothetical protein